MKLNKYIKSDFLKNIITLSSGSIIANLITFFSAPILYRIYDKSDYGTLALYSSFVGVIAVFSTMQYLQPILLEKDEKNVISIVWLARFINILIALLVSIIIFFFGEIIAVFLGNSEISFWLYILPISIFFTAQNEILRVIANRKKYYKIMSINTILISLLVPIISISFGIINSGPLGLFLGLLASHIIPALILFIYIKKNNPEFNFYFNATKMKRLAKTYKNFPIYVLPSEFINRFTNQLPVFMLSKFSGPEVVGLYNLTVKMLGLPIQLVGSSISEVFRKRAVQDFHKIGHFSKIFLKTLKYLTLISILPIIIILFFGTEIFSFIFGIKWAESGELAKILILFFSLKMIVSPLSYSYFIRNKLKEDMLLHIYMFISNLAVFIIGFNYLDYAQVLILFVINYAMIYSFTLYRSYSFSKI